MRQTLHSAMLLCLAGTLFGCDVRGLFGETFLSPPRPCGPGVPCPAGSSCDSAAGLCRAALDAAAPGCRDHGECGPAGLCRLDEDFPGAGLAAVGGCVPADRVCVINADRCMAGADGTPDRPLCEVQDAQARGGRCAFALVQPRADGRRYGPLRLTSGALAVVGPGRDAQRPATLGGIDVSGGASLSLVDLTVENPGQTAVRCSEGAHLQLRRAVVQGSGLGVEAYGCAELGVNASRISGNRNDGLHIEAAEWRVVNTLILGNAFDAGAAASGVYLKGGRGSFSFNTVVGNGRMGENGGGVSCTAGPERFITLSDSVIAGNQLGDLRSQLLGACRLERVVVGTDSVMGDGAIKLEPQLDPVTFRLTERSDCCIDRAQKDPMVQVDYDGTPRPQRAGHDIGFNELK